MRATWPSGSPRGRDTLPSNTARLSRGPCRTGRPRPQSDERHENNEKELFLLGISAALILGLPLLSVSASGNELDPEIQAVLQKGTSAGIDHFTAALLGLKAPGDEQVPSVFRSFTDRARTVRHRIDVIDQGKRVLMTTLIFETERADSLSMRCGGESANSDGRHEHTRRPYGASGPGPAPLQRGKGVLAQNPQPLTAGGPLTFFSLAR